MKQIIAQIQTTDLQRIMPRLARHSFLSGLDIKAI